MHIRPVKHTDADMLFTFFEQLDRETNFLLFEPGERNPSRQRQEIRLQQILESNSERMWVVTDEQRISGYLGLRRGNVHRNRHAAIIAMGLLQSCCGQGWGAKLLQHAESWARGHQIHRLGLTVMTHNERALRLYQKQGFVIEGLQKDSLLVNGTYVDEYLMAKILT
ncbi:Protein N-acetyltransferase, RimJ/RimL family [Laceyella tengchongensis]|uniref:Protein N-acetyltransferase, RimJ/RimL family n=1 Tax=Laceyella tengchongensis TaxID=574699 RepID=A0AA46AF37_9BACL|nr:GNAT family N-acetyltransferase [Laceyella tengchongensis]SMP17166.1 Protein N-acetyltransferase, RimJ/RimL family [Laceyella tengchongensis]